MFLQSALMFQLERLINQNYISIIKLHTHFLSINYTMSKSLIVIIVLGTYCYIYQCHDRIK